MINDLKILYLACYKIQNKPASICKNESPIRTSQAQPTLYPGDMQQEVNKQYAAADHRSQPPTETLDFNRSLGNWKEKQIDWGGEVKEV